MTVSSKQYIFYYNSPAKYKNDDAVCLDYRKDSDKKNVTFQLPKFVEDVGFIPDRFLDLLEIASYIYCADRFVSRGSKDSPYFTGWQRRFKHIIFVRDYNFWSDNSVIELLETLLNFLSGDIHQFEFNPGHKTPKVNMFDGEEFWPPSSDACKVAMFSGGLDSTSGVYDILLNTGFKLYLTSHISSPGIKKTQTALVKELKRRFPNRIFHLMFSCSLSGTRAREETQRTRSFLYASVGAAVARRYRQNSILFFENGILSINFPPSDQFQNVRTTRSTHPKVLHYFGKLFSLVNESEFKVENPFFWKSKADIIHLLKENNGSDLISSTVSCSRTFDKGVKHIKTHCGRCSQCIDRRFGFAGARMMEDENRGIYAYDFVVDNICSDNDHDFGREERTMLVDYVRLALNLQEMNVDTFYDNWLDQLVDITDYIEGTTEEEKIIKLHELFSRHGKQVKNGIVEFQKSYADILLVNKPKPNSLSEILSTREYLDQPAQLIATKISTILKDAVPIAFQNKKPKNEQEVQDQIEALLKKHERAINREFPHVPFALSKTVPDFSMDSPYVYVEVKYPRGKSSPSKTNKEIAEDCTRYPNNAYLLFVVYDPERKVKDDTIFIKDFIKKRECQFCFIR